MTGPNLSDPPAGGERQRLVRGLTQPTARAARFLLGQILVRRNGAGLQAARIVETEAYLGVEDAAAHAFRGRTARTEPIWGPPGTLYVYLIYGLHYCLNVVAEREGTAGCILIRAADPLPYSGLDPSDCRGPGRLCRALGIDTRLSGASGLTGEAGLYLREGAGPRCIAISTRVGIQKAADRPLRFFDESSAAVSRGPATISRVRPRPRRS
jgi:DNA-3-methyladenine glycosylase